MNLTSEPGSGATDLHLAVKLAGAASEMLLELQRTAVDRQLTPEQLKTQGDAESQLLISAALDHHRPTDAVLSEEAADNLVRLQSDRVWIIDPLDGTREFSEGRTDWAVHVALWQGGKLSVGAVALPGHGVILDSSPRVVEESTYKGRMRIAVSRSRPPSIVNALAESTHAELVPMGSAGYKACAVVRGEVDAYVHAGGQYEWDSAAPVIVAHSRGFHTSRVDGSPLEYNQRDPYLPDLLICRPNLADFLVKELKTLI
ncbi:MULTISPECIES: 3'(2'),5'-bisphosphate nucleotidase CysQ [unclassified Arthrobacter]|uniref:3'(2'),5'-bisphosphate nucleotidase CysQ n=1 Tax=unclassified Arthrobacter TaxID=235627 RepID=UPI0014919E8D|nr:MULTISPECIES: 3'(2'),5'-bisphosphate nucleotidase CysQ [unclassified Arthrobacter]MBE0009068.1 3'(2'),5'-bisphosphate nucleotidase CysQ [Arthrobacter sp. AET 35A]NOJ62802.1 3'(2'),5'-bisphosphate nucleotidase CysQ [Arthrobacter sp. 147(2020)]